MKKNVKKVLLIHPEISRSKYNFNGIIENEPLELEYIVSILNREKYENEIFDVQRENISLENKLSKYKPDIIYICGRIKQYNYMIEHVKTSRRICPNSMIIVGGLHAQINYQDFFIDELDYVLTTFDVFKIVDLIKNKGIKKISGICYKKDNKWIINPAKPFDINRLPHPDRTYFYEHSDRYRYLEIAPCAQIRTSYCCAFKCRFCYRNLTNCGKYVYRDIKDVVAEIEEIKCDSIYFVDDDFLLNPARLRELIKLVKEKNIKKKYICFGRVDFILRNKELMKELRDIGFYYVLVGLEATTNKRLSNYNKYINVDNNVECVRFMNEIGINIMGMFITDLDFRKKDFNELYKWIKENKLSHVAVSIFTPIPGTKSYEDYKDTLITNNKEMFDYLHVVAKPKYISIRKYYYYYYILCIKLFILAKHYGVYDFMNYGYYIKTIIKTLLHLDGDTNE